ncbi:MAG TPA: hypothetical protein VF557_14300 [Jatrophihabitans sp.]|uniref:hypothetical protein n=1 Tax=Jatrophihabitans sp. TaxID=1932789 RepID=UPI002EE35D55
MNALEDRLRAALKAKSDAVTLDETEAPAQAISTEVIRLVPDVAARPQRRIATVLAAVAAAAVLALAVGTLVAGGGDGSSAGRVGNRTEVPWNRVGPGWTLVQDTTHTTRDQQGYPHLRSDTPERLLLIDPSGVKYLISTVDPQRWLLTGWSERTDRALFEPQGETNQSSTSVLVVDLRTGTNRTVTAPGVFFSARFSGPDDQSILFEDQQTLAVYSLAGRLQARFSGSGRDLFPATVSSRDGTQIIVGSKAGLAVRDARTGQLVRTLAPPIGFGACDNLVWQPHGELVAACRPVKPAASSLDLARLFMFSRGDTLTPARTDPRLVPGTTNLGLRQGYLAIQQRSYPLVSRADATAVRVGADGRQEPVPIPAAFDGANWIADRGDAGMDTVALVRAKSDAEGYRDALASWNPFTGKVTELYRAATPTGILITNVPWRDFSG